jgi:hypothetical protein
VTRKRTQLERVIDASRSFRGTCQADFLGDTVDGLPNITRVGARIQEAEEQGYVFEIVGWRNKTKAYRLVSEPDVESGRREGRPPPEKAEPPSAPSSPASALSAGEPGALFETEPTRTSHYDSERAA